MPAIAATLAIGLSRVILSSFRHGGYSILSNARAMHDGDLLQPLTSRLKDCQTEPLD